MPTVLVTLLGKAVRLAARIRGGGSALPGLFVERIDPNFIKKTLGNLPHGIVVVSGTNGKTTTTKMVVELLEGQGLKVFTNRTGSNFTRGVAAALLGEVSASGKLRADIAVLELDEAHAVHFVKAVPPRYSLLLNVMRDQLDRFGEIDATARLLQSIAEATSERIIVNREDPRLRRFVDNEQLHPRLTFFGLSKSTRSLFPNDDDMRTKTTSTSHLPTADVVLETLDGQAATFLAGDAKLHATLQLQGIYNIYNAAAALAVTRTVMGDEFDSARAIASLQSVTPAFGRGEVLVVGGQPCELVLVKNPGGFRLGLKSFNPDGWRTMIAINDQYADGRDMSWLWDVDFDSLRSEGVSEVSGIRAYDMALRLQYDDVDVAHVDTDLGNALQHFLSSHASYPKRIYCTYTAMLQLRKLLSKITTVEVVA